MISKKTRSILSECLNLDETNIDKKLNINNTADWDSLAHLRLVCAIEEEIGRSLSAMEVLNIESASDVENLISHD